MRKIIWVLLDNRMGSVGQAKGVMQELNSSQFDIITKELKYSSFAGLPNFIRGSSLLGVSNPEILQGDVPHLVISTSRRTVPVALFLKKKNPNTLLVQLMHPGLYGISKFARIFLPQHDAHKKALPNFYFTVGSAHRINKEVLSKAHQKWEEKFRSLPRPLTALIIGGSIKGKPFVLDNAKALAQEVKSLKERIGGSLLITDSRRTGGEAEKLIIDTLKDIPMHSYLWGSKDDNPLLGYYACSDNLVVTGDSVSMCCEACGTGKPVFIFEGQNWLTPKHLRFTKSLFDGKYACLLKDGCETFNCEKVLYPSAEIATEITNLLQ